MRKIIFATIFLLLGGCSSQFVYNNMDWMIHWYLDDYIDLNKAQRNVFDERFAVWHSWHRKEELVKYREQLNSIRALVESNTFTQDNLQAQFDQIRGHWEHLRGHIAPDLAAMASSLSDEQVKSMFEALAKDNKEEQDKQDLLYEKTEQERMDKRQKDIEQNLSEWVGKLSDEQKSIIAGYVPQFRSNWQEWINYHKTVQGKAEAIFATRKENPAFKEELLTLMTDPEAYRSEKMVANSEFNGRLYSALIADISKSLTDKQRKKLLHKLDGYIEDITDLIGDD